MSAKKWKWFWIAWLIALGVGELIATMERHRGKPKPRTFTEHLSRWFPRGRRRVLLILLMVLLTLHFAPAPDVVQVQAWP